MKIFTKLFILSIFFAGTVSCVRQSFDLEECVRKVRIEPEWINTEPVNDAGPVHISVASRVPGTSTLYMETDRYGKDVDLLPGTYDLIGWEDAANVTVNERIVTLAEGADGFAAEPGEFSGGTAYGETVKEVSGTQILYVPMRQQTRELIIRINFNGDLSILIEKVEAVVSGIALSRDIDEGFEPADGQPRHPAITSGEAYYLFAVEPNPLRQIWYRGEHRLIGIDGDAPQELEVRVAGVDGSFTPVFLDISEAMDKFHVDNDVRKPLVINLYLNLGLHLDLVIENWEFGDESIINVS